MDASRVRRLEALGDREVEDLGDVLIECVEGGASVSFMFPMTREKADGALSAQANYSSGREGGGGVDRRIESSGTSSLGRTGSARRISFGGGDGVGVTGSARKIGFVESGSARSAFMTGLSVGASTALAWFRCDRRSLPTQPALAPLSEDDYLLPSIPEIRLHLPHHDRVLFFRVLQN